MESYLHHRFKAEKIDFAENHNFSKDNRAGTYAIVTV